MQREIMKAISIAVVLSVAALSAGAQRFKFDRFNADSGLASSFVLQIEQDARGHIWFVTLHGLTRFDGRDFRTFGTADGMIDGRTSAFAIAPNGDVLVGTASGLVLWDGYAVRNVTADDGLGRGSVWAIATEPSGRAWVGTQSGGLSSIEGNVVRTYTTDDGLPSNFVYALAVDSRGRLWIGTRDAGMAMAVIGEDGVPDIRRRWSAGDGLTSPIVRAFHEEPDGAMLVGTRGGGMFRVDGEGRLSRVAPQLAEEDAYTIRKSGEGGIIVGLLGRGVAICSPPAYERCRTLDASRGLPSTAVLSVLEDREGSLWIGTTSGAFRLTGHDFLNYGEREGLSSDYVFGVVPDRDGSLWVSSQNGVSRLEPGGHGRPPTARTLTTADGLPTDEVWDVLRDPSGRLWLGTANGLCLFAPGRGCATFGPEHGLPSRNVTVLHEDADGRIWAGTRSGAVRLATNVRPDSTSIADLTVLDGIEVFAIEHDPGGALWFVCTDAVARREGDQVRVWRSGEELGANSVADVLATRDGSVWFATNDEGIGRVDPSRAAGSGTLLRLYGTESGLPSLAIRTLLEDDEGMIWAGSTAGLLELDPRKAGTSAFVVRQFTLDDGLVSQEPTSQHAFARDAKGSLWFGFSGGLTRYLDLEEMRAEDPPLPGPAVIITTIHAGGTRVHAAPFVTMVPHDRRTNRTGIEAPLGDRDVSIDYSVAAFRGRRTLEVQTRLDGYDSRWSVPTRRFTKDYTQLPPGSYTFRIRARLGNGPWGDETTAPLVIPPLFWETPWFRAILALAAVAVLFTAHRVRTYRMHRHNQELAALVALHTRALEERSRELEETNIELEHTNIELDTINRLLKDADLAKSRFLARMSHELRTPLNSIIGFTDLMQDESRDMPPEKRRRFLRNVRHSATILLGLINDILDLSKIEAGKMEVHVEETNVGEVVEEVVETMRVSADERKSHIFVEVDSSLPPVHVDAVKVRQILQNLISNSIKYSDDGATIRVSARRVPVERHGLGVEAFELAVDDDGRGIPADQLDGIFDEYRRVRANASSATGTGLGLAIVSRFSELQGGRVSAESTPAKGSTFRVWLPVDARHWDSERG